MPWTQSAWVAEATTATAAARLGRHHRRLEARESRSRAIVRRALRHRGRHRRARDRGEGGELLGVGRMIPHDGEAHLLKASQSCFRLVDSATEERGQVGGGRGGGTVAPLEGALDDDDGARGAKGGGRLLEGKGIAVCPLLGQVSIDRCEGLDVAHGKHLVFGTQFRHLRESRLARLALHTERLFELGRLIIERRLLHDERRLERRRLRDGPLNSGHLI
mmetsp:Transcript_77786/g.154546  ORF Transcript_77786/g.154546 Transcript_77786/m.154546 type:complete len:219 (-) Transcript_77786:1920-2576(-)